MGNINDLCDEAIRELNTYLGEHFNNSENRNEIIDQLADSYTPFQQNEIQILLKDLEGQKFGSQNEGENETQRKLTRTILTTHISQRLHEALHLWGLDA